MKTKILMVIMLLIMISGIGANAQTVTIPAANTNSGSVNDPFGTDYGYERTALIYTAAEIGGITGDINKIRFYLNSSNFSCGDVVDCRIYMKTRNDIFTGSSTYTTETTGATLVYGPITLPDFLFGYNEWITINLTTPFNYTGNNIEIIVETNVGGNGNENVNGKQFRYFTQTSNKYYQYWERNTNPPGGSGTLSTSRPNVQLVFCTQPVNDNCFDVTPVALTCGVTQTFTGTGACSSSELSDPGFTEVWIAFNIPSAGMDLKIDFCGSMPVHDNAYLSVFTDCSFASGTFTPTYDYDWTACADGNITLYWTGLPAGNYWYPILIDPAWETPYTVHVLGTCCSSNSIPYTEGFNATSFPSCWQQQYVTGTSTFSFVTSSTNPATTPQEGTHFAFWNSYYISALNETRLVSPPINTVGAAIIDVRFFWMNEHNNSYESGNYLNEGVQVQYSLNGTSWTDVAGGFVPRHDGTLPAGTSQWKKKTFTLDGIAGNQPILYVGFKFHSEYGDNCSMDNVWIGKRFTDPLPIQLLSFDGSCTNDVVTLNWATATEINNDYFTIEKSSDMQNWKLVKQIPGAGNSNQKLDYTTTDKSTGDKYYRLKQTDFDGKFEIFPPISVVCSKSGTSPTVSVHPNPTTGMLYIEASSELSEIQIFEGNGGQMKYTGKEAAINMSSFSPGLYFIRITTVSGDIFFRKIIKQ